MGAAKKHGTHLGHQRLGERDEGLGRLKMGTGRGGPRTKHSRRQRRPMQQGSIQPRMVTRHATATWPPHEHRSPKRRRNANLCHAVNRAAHGVCDGGGGFTACTPTEASRPVTHAHSHTHNGHQSFARQRCGHASRASTARRERRQGAALLHFALTHRSWPCRCLGGGAGTGRERGGGALRATTAGVRTPEPVRAQVTATTRPTVAAPGAAGYRAGSGVPNSSAAGPPAEPTTPTQDSAAELGEGPSHTAAVERSRARDDHRAHVGIACGCVQQSAEERVRLQGKGVEAGGAVQGKRLPNIEAKGAKHGEGVRGCVCACVRLCVRGVCGVWWAQVCARVCLSVCA
jgi:hypothetical protein